MKFAIATLLLLVLASTVSMAEQPNGNHYGNDKNGISGNKGNKGNKGNNKVSASVPAPGTLVIMGIGLAGIIIFRRREK
jgi:hypothetical protein